jgi:predicted transport protein
MRPSGAYDGGWAGRWMSEITLFKISGRSAVEIPGEAVALEKSLQSLIEANLETFLGVRFLATEQNTGKVHKGRIDTLGIDENHFPVIVEYKRATNQNVINQGLFYLDWLLDHRADFKLLTLERYGKEAADKIDWSGPRLICIAADFTPYDVHAVQQIDRNIDLMRYRRFGEGLLALELIYSVTMSEGLDVVDGGGGILKIKPKITDKPVTQAIADLDPPLGDVYEALRAFVLALGTDVTEKLTKLYVAFRIVKNFATVTVQKSNLYVYVKLDPTTMKLEEGFTRDVRSIGHWGTGDLEIAIRSMADFERAKPLLQQAHAGA